MARPADQPDSRNALSALAGKLAGSAALIGFSRMQRSLAALEAEARKRGAGRQDADRLHQLIAAVNAMMPEGVSDRAAS